MGSDVLEMLKELCGYVEDGSNDVVKLFRDEVTKIWFCEVGKRSYQGACLMEAIDNAFMTEIEGK